MERLDKNHNYLSHSDSSPRLEKLKILVSHKNGLDSAIAYHHSEHDTDESVAKTLLDKVGGSLLKHNYQLVSKYIRKLLDEPNSGKPVGFYMPSGITVPRRQSYTLRIHDIKGVLNDIHFVFDMKEDGAWEYARQWAEEGYIARCDRAAVTAHLQTMIHQRIPGEELSVTFPVESRYANTKNPDWNGQARLSLVSHKPNQLVDAGHGRMAALILLS